MVSQILDFYYDFGSPNAYFAWKALQGVSERTGLKVNMHPVLIGGIFKSTGNQPPWQACLLYTSPSPRDATLSRMPSSA